MHVRAHTRLRFLPFEDPGRSRANSQVHVGVFAWKHASKSAVSAQRPSFAAAAACVTPTPHPRGALVQRRPTFVAASFNVSCVCWHGRDSARSNLSNDATIAELNLFHYVNSDDICQLIL